MNKRKKALRAAFVEDYLVLCSQYGLVIDAKQEEEEFIGLEIVSNKNWDMPMYTRYMKGRI